MFAERLKKLRLEADMKQSDLGKLLGVSASTIGMYEQGRRYPDFETLIKIANYFNVSLDFLLGRSDIKDTSYFIDGKPYPKDIVKIFMQLEDATPEKKEIIIKILEDLK